MRRHDFCSALDLVRRKEPRIEDERGTTDLLRAIIRHELQVKSRTAVAPPRIRMLVRDLRVRVPKPA
ncbi:MAG TPA: hypothetical protein VLB44_27795 [Kofleriaceae bacterium]|nr:hypothetical protein [Kofleriaceae bacterium]